MSASEENLRSDCSPFNPEALVEISHKKKKKKSTQWTSPGPPGIAGHPLMAGRSPLMVRNQTVYSPIDLSLKRI